MTSDVKGQRDLDSYHLGYLLQVVVDVVAHVSVSSSLVCDGILYYCEQVLGSVFWVLVEYYLHFLCPFDD